MVIAAGPHADELQGLPRRPLIDVVAETVVMARVSSAEQRRLAGLPSIIVDDVDDHLYIVPPTEYPDGQVYVKLGATRHDQWVLSPEDRRVWMTGAQHEADLDWLRGLMLGVLPGLQAEAWSTKPCLIPDTPTKLPYLEIVEPGLVMAVGTNGYAAKSADAIGALAAGLALNGCWTDTELDATVVRVDQPRLIVTCAPLADRRPAGTAEDVAELGAKSRRRAHVAGDVGHLVVGDSQRVVRVDVLGQPVLHPPQLRFEGAEQLVPQDQDAAVVLVEVLIVGAVVAAVM